jgi:hypothetical protein
MEATVGLVFELVLGLVILVLGAFVLGRDARRNR